MDKVWLDKNLIQAFQKVKENQGSPGIDGQTVEDFEANVAEELQGIQKALREKSYEPRPVKRVYIPKDRNRKRPLGIPTVKDRVVQQSLRTVIEPIFEEKFLDCSYGFRPGRSAHMAMEAIEGYLKEGCLWVVDADLTSYFDSIPHEKLIDRVAEEISDGSVLKLIRKMLQAGVMEDGIWTCEETGTPQGGVISPLLANIYLHPFDETMTQRGHRLVRYADDWVILCRSKPGAERVLRGAIKLLGESGLTINPEKTRIVNAAEEGFDFLGYHFQVFVKDKPDGKEYDAWKRPSDKATRRFKERVKEITRRNQTVNVKETVVKKLNRYLQGWVGYYGRGRSKKRFEELDGWMRRRIRMVQMRSWKTPKKMRSILIAKGWSPEDAKKISMRRWRNSACTMAHTAMDLKWFKDVGFKGLKDRYCEMALS